MDFRMPNPECRTNARRRGFSFTEILFAVMILGIGFIMVAAMFPVAIHQTEANNQETITAAVARSSSNFMTQLAAMPLPPAAIQYYSLSTSTTQTPSILLPTFSNPNSPGASLPVASSYILPAYQSTMVIPGQVWTMYDTRDPWVYMWSAPLTGTSTHASVLWPSIAKNLIQQGDMRFGWAVMYRRDVIVRGPPGSTGTSIAPATFAQIIMIGVQCRNTQLYNPATDTPNPPRTTLTPSATPSPFLPTLVGNIVNASGATPTGSGVMLIPPAFIGGPSYVNFSAVGGFPAMLTDMTYVVISDDNVPMGMASHGTLNGRIFRVGIAPGAGSAWQLLPGSDMTISDQTTLVQMTSDKGGTAPQFNVLIVGRGPSGTGYAGPAQDVAAYSTYVPISN